jgi:cytochrome P450
MDPAFSRRLIDGLVPRFHALANELIDGFETPGKAEFISGRVHHAARPGH